MKNRWKLQVEASIMERFIQFDANFASTFKFELPRFRFSREIPGFPPQKAQREPLSSLIWQISLKSWKSLVNCCFWSVLFHNWWKQCPTVILVYWCLWCMVGIVKMSGLTAGPFNSFTPSLSFGRAGLPPRPVCRDHLSVRLLWHQSTNFLMTSHNYTLDKMPERASVVVFW